MLFIAVDDCGNKINPMIVEGQVHGGVMQGAGQVLGEHCVYDPETAQLLTGSFMDYYLPRADGMPEFRIAEHPVPCTTNPLGAKGAGEAGTTGALAAIMNEEVVTAPRSPWQNAYVERIIGSIRRECLDHVIVFDERHLRRVLSAYFEYHHRSRTHLSLAKDCPEPRPIQPSSAGNVVAFPQVGGLHHRYERRAA